MPIADPPPPVSGTTMNITGSISSSGVLDWASNLADAINAGKINADALDIEDLRARLRDDAHDEAERLVNTAKEMSASMGISLKEAMDALATAASHVRVRAIAETGAPPSQRMSISVDEYGLLMRVANMAAQLLPAIREDLGEKEYARYTALRNALVALQVNGTTVQMPSLVDDELAQDLISLAADLEPPTGPKTS